MSKSAPKTRWVKAARSGGNGGNCVEVQAYHGAVYIRDSKYGRNPANLPENEPIIELPASEWAAFLASVANTSNPASATAPSVTYLASGLVTLEFRGTTLTYTTPEWDAFLNGVRGGEFDLKSLAIAA